MAEIIFTEAAVELESGGRTFVPSTMFLVLRRVYDEYSAQREVVSRHYDESVVEVI